MEKKKVSVQTCRKYIYMIQWGILCQWTVFGHWISQWAREKKHRHPCWAVGQVFFFGFHFYLYWGFSAFLTVFYVTLWSLFCSFLNEQDKSV